MKTEHLVLLDMFSVENAMFQIYLKSVYIISKWYSKLLHYFKTFKDQLFSYKRNG